MNKVIVVGAESTRTLASVAQELQEKANAEIEKLGDGWEVVETIPQYNAIYHPKNLPGGVSTMEYAGCNGLLVLTMKSTK